MGVTQGDWRVVVGGTEVGVTHGDWRVVLTDNKDTNWHKCLGVKVVLCMAFQKTVCCVVPCVP